MIIFRKFQTTLVTIQVLYYVPRCQFVLNTFTWQTEDEVPGLPRIHRFLTYWQHNIEAVIKEVSVSDAGSAVARWRHGNLFQT
jgi:uncharacterized protein Usg